MRFILCLVLPLSLSACSLFSTTPSAESVLNQGINTLDGYTYASGTGTTKEEATLAARLALSEQIYVHVSSEFKAAQQQVKESSSDDMRVSTSEEVTSFMANSTSVLLSDVQVEVSTKVQEGWLVTVKMPTHKMDEVRQRTDRQAPALAYALLMKDKESLSPGAILRYAILGLEKTLEQGIANELIYGPGVPANTTFEVFFQNAIEESKRRLTLLPITNDNRVRFVLIDAKTYEPQNDFVIYINGINLKTNHSGKTRFVSLEQLPEHFSPILLGYHQVLNSSIDKDLLKMSAINTSDLTNFSQTTIYVHTQPSNALVTLLNGTTVLATEFQDKVFSVSSEYNMLKLTAESGEDSHRTNIEMIGQPVSANLYYSIKLSEKSFGLLDISVPSSKNTITLKDSNNTIIMSGSNRIKKELEVGRYHINISNADQLNYQSIDDSFTIYKNREFKRDYKALKNRRFYHYGHISDLTLGFGSRLADEFEIPLKDGSVMTNQAFMQQFDSDHPNNFSAALRHMRLTNAKIAISYGIDFGLRNYKQAITKNRASLWSVGANAGVGLWSGKILGKAGWITANYNYSFYDWQIDDDNSLVDSSSTPKVDSFSRGYPFLDIGARWDAYGIGLRLSDPSLAAPMLYLSFGSTAIQSGYELSEHSTAIKGVNF